MKRMSTLIMASVLLFISAMPMTLAAAELYKWTDADGKVHYSETRPTHAEPEKLRTPASPPAASVEHPQNKSIRGTDGNCLTVKCLADEMEGKRRLREEEQQRLSSENDRQREAHLQQIRGREQCLRGLCGDKTINCDDPNWVRKCSADRARLEGRKP